MRITALAVIALAVLLALPAHAQDFELSGYGDVRLVHPSDQQSYLDGGLGKLRWGAYDRSDGVDPELGALVLRGIATEAESGLEEVAELRYDSQQKTAVDILDAYARWRPVSTTRWRWAVKAGAFWAPVSLENTGIGWSTEWTLTPSALNSWVGDELRTLGGEATLEWRGDIDHLEAKAAVFGWNEPAGVELADRGWAFDDQPIGLLDHARLPNVVAEEFAAPGQAYGALYSDEFRQIDGSPGWYASLSWDRPDYGRISILRYDNEANPAAHDSEFAWHTDFWNIGYSTEIGDHLVVLAQAMTGRTVIAPAPAFTDTTDFHAAYVLVGWQQGEWRYALRLDQFGTRDRHPGDGLRFSEHGKAVTAAITWTPLKWLRLTGEILAVDSWRPQRLLDDDTSPRAIESQLQLAARVSF